jgi:CrcB protein
LDEQHTMNWLAVMIGGAAGCALRYGVSGWLQPASAHFPWGTFAVNVTGSLALGFLGRYFAPPYANHSVFLLLTVGFCGGYTTFSTFALDTLTIVERGASMRALLYVLASVIASYVAVVAGYASARSLRPMP